MLFRRRNQPGVGERLRQAVWPTSGWKRTTSYFFKRVLRLSGSPHAIAAGVAAGVFASFTPFIGFHFIIGFAVAFMIGGNLLAAALGTAVGNPLTFPAIWLASYKVGNFILGADQGYVSRQMLSRSMSEQPFEAILPLLRPLVIGGVPLGIAFGGIAYLAVYWAVKAYQRAKRTRLAARRESSKPDTTKAGARESA